MKKIFNFIFAAIAAVSMTACANNEAPSGANIPTSENFAVSLSESTKSTEETVPETESAVISEETAAETTEDTQEDESNAALIVYFSWSGNTEAVANEIAAQTGADIFELIPETPYTDDYDELLDIAQNEQSSGARPLISGSVDLSDHDTIFIGYPNWWADMPMIVYTFFDEYDLSGKTIAPFCTSGGSGFSGTLRTIAELEPDAEITEGLHISSSSAGNSSDDVSKWLSETGLLN
ncbi:MAG: flavodoxin [Huintestinicola sp.]|uniref:flavodoxin n=1 Tax=Huintestinicola sp. TaxID=2981661 RepID=UPI003F10B5C4